MITKHKQETHIDESKWQPIESVPRDGTTVLLFRKDGDGISMRHYNEQQKGWYPGGSSDGWHSHWMPLPPNPPTNKE